MSFNAAFTGNNRNRTVSPGRLSPQFHGFSHDKDGDVIHRFLQRRRKARSAAADATAEPPPAAHAAEDLGTAVRDMSASGWWNQDRGELYPEFAIGKDDIVLDVGCGVGGKTAFCARQGARIVFVDIDESAVSATLRMLQHEGAAGLMPIVSDCDPLPLQDGVATRIVASEMLEHVDDPARILKELVRVGRPGSLYLITVPDPASQGLQQELAPPLYFQKPNHVRIIGREEFGRLVTDAGLEIVHRGADGFYSAMWWNFFWTAGVPLDNPGHPLREAWSATWQALLDTPGGLQVKNALDAFMPMSQCIVARKPGGPDRVPAGDG
jgi:SAM-dependent methyltransferase